MMRCFSVVPPSQSAPFAAAADGLISLESVSIADVSRVPQDLDAGQQLDITGRAAGLHHADAFVLVARGVFGPILLQRVLRGGFVAETGFLIAPKDNRPPPRRLTASPDLERRRSTGVTVWNCHARRWGRSSCRAGEIRRHITHRRLPMPDRGLRCGPGG
jgi:hypothetical protein